MAVASLVVMFFAGCGGHNAPITPPTAAPQALAITTQPASQGARIGQTATFSVAVNATDGASYQWSKNGIAINGATGASYITPATTAIDEDSVFNVTVTNAVSSLTSRDVHLVLNPPQANDLRFQQVDSAMILDGYDATLRTNILGTAIQPWGNYGAPLQVSEDAYCAPGNIPADCAWFFWLFSTPFTGMTTAYQSGVLANFQGDLFALDFHTVATSVNMQTANNAYAISSVKTDPTATYSPVATQSLPAFDFQFEASAQGAMGHVITAVAFNDTLVQYVSYGLTGDHNIYEAQVNTATLATIAAQAADLAQNGYFITAVGGDTTNGFFVVGTRVQGDTMPRPLKIINTATQDPASLFQQGYSIVASISNADASTTWVGEK